MRLLSPQQDNDVEAGSYTYQHPVYLHFLDRELGDSVGFRAEAGRIEHILKILALGCSSTFYCGISLLWENPGLNQDCHRFLALLNEADVLDPVSYSGTMEEFYESRIRLYAHDAQRYPHYFSRAPGGLRSIRATLHKPQDTTQALIRDLDAWAEGAADNSGNRGEQALKVTSQALRARQGEAVTYSFFHPFIEKSGGSPFDTGKIRRQISLAYSRHYLAYADGDIATGIKGLSFFDEMLATHFPHHDVHLLGLLLEAVGLGFLFKRPWTAYRDFWEAYLFGLRDTDGYRISESVHRVLDSVYARLPTELRDGSQYAARARISGSIRRLREEVRSSIPPPSTSAPHAGDAAVTSILSTALRTCERMAGRVRRPDHLPASRKPIGRTRESAQNILLLTATQLETRCVLETFSRAFNRKYTTVHGESTTYFRLARIGGSDIFLAQSEAGALGPAGSTLTASDSIRFLDPGAVIIVGIAFGADPNTQEVGDIIVSRQVVAYESQRVNDSAAPHRIVPRGDRVSASPRLLARCRTTALDWDRSAVHFGLILSGEKLIDSSDFLGQLTAQFGNEAVGGEMEGAGVYSAAYRHRKDWIIVKAVSDWADGTKNDRKEERQALAAANAAGFVVKLAAGGGLVPG